MAFKFLKRLKIVKKVFIEDFMLSALKSNVSYFNKLRNLPFHAPSVHFTDLLNIRHISDPNIFVSKRYFSKDVSMKNNDSSVFGVGKLKTVKFPKDFKLKLARKEQIPRVYELISKRVDLLNSKGIKQWRWYLNYFPIEYFYEKVDEGMLFVFEKEGKVVGLCILLIDDDRWPNNNDKAIYFHALCTDVSTPSVGPLIVSEIERIGRYNNFQYCRCDNDSTNPWLNNYYESLGYKVVDSYHIDTPYESYTGYRRQKIL